MTPPPERSTTCDLGSQYLSAAYQARLRAHGLRPSAGRAGRCWENAAAESFFATLKTELDQRSWPTRQAARTAVYSYIETFYNRRRRHSAIAYLTPQEYEQPQPPTLAAA